MLRQLARTRFPQHYFFFESCKLSGSFQYQSIWRKNQSVLYRGFATKETNQQNEGANYNKEFAEKLFNVSSYGVDFQKLSKSEFVESNKDALDKSNIFFF